MITSPLSDEDLINKIVSNQTYSIKLLEIYKDNPLWIPPPTQAQRKEYDRDWEEALKRGLGATIDKKIQEILDERS